MSARILDGVPLANAIRAEVAEAVKRYAGSGNKPGLAVVIVGENPASQVYVKAKGKACDEAGMHSETVRLPEQCTEADLLEACRADLAARLAAAGREVVPEVS